ncbi:hypothetical protein GmHk_03G006593 [Glycine max]|nr:hypothetical protein GmHk_03G006593 [Glycine max]
MWSNSNFGRRVLISSGNDFNLSEPITLKVIKLGAGNPSLQNDTKLGHWEIIKEHRLLNDSAPETKRDSIFSQLWISRSLRFGKVTNGRDVSESQLLPIDSVSSNSCLCCVGNSSFLRSEIYRLFSDSGKRPPGNDTADEESLNVKDRRQVGWMLVMASIMDSTIGLPSTSIEGDSANFPLVWGSQVFQEFQAQEKLLNRRNSTPPNKACDQWPEIQGRERATQNDNLRSCKNLHQ